MGCTRLARCAGSQQEDVESQDDKFNRTEIDDPDLALQEPIWGEPVP